MDKIVIIGGSDAGISAALRIRELLPDAGVTIVLADDFPNFSICGLPFYLSGEISDWHSLAHRTREEIISQGINLLTKHLVTKIDTTSKIITALAPNEQSISLPYDRLIIGTGAVSRKPPIDGLELPGVFCLRWMDDCFRLHQYLEEKKVQKVIIIGGGYIGLEMADAFTLRGINVSVVEYFSTVLNTVHSSFGKIIGDKLLSRGISLYTNKQVKMIEQSGNQLLIRDSSDFTLAGDLVLVSGGATPATAVAFGTGISLNAQGAIMVNRRMETSIADIYAAGDCVETWHQLLERPVYMPLGTTAHKQGRVAGENAAGGSRQFEGSLGTQVVKVFDLAIARTGLRKDEAKKAGYNPRTVNFKNWDHKVYYPGAHPIQIRLTADTHSKRILGGQIIGHYQGQVAKRIDILATAIYHKTNLEQLNDLDLSYTPPLSSPWDPVQMAAQEWMKRVR